MLGVDPSASPAQIHDAYRRRAREAHPDISGEPEASMAAVNAAWFILRDPARRAEHDRDRGGAQPVDRPVVDVPQPSTTPVRLLGAMLVIAILLSTIVLLAVFLIGFGRVGG